MSATATYSTSAVMGIEEFSATRERTLAMLGQLTQRQLDYAPAPDRWSAGEVLDHMLLAERINREQIARLIEMRRQGRKPELSLTFSDLNIAVSYIPRSVLPVLELPLTLLNMFVPESLRNYLTRHALVSFKNPDAAAPRRGRTISQLREDLTTSLKETEALFQRDPHLEYGEMVLRHPLLGSYNIPGLLRFMAAHEQRHQSQINNIIASPQFPRPPSSGNGGPHVKL